MTKNEKIASLTLLLIRSNMSVKKASVTKEAGITDYVPDWIKNNVSGTTPEQRSAFAEIQKDPEAAKLLSNPDELKAAFQKYKQFKPMLDMAGKAQGFMQNNPYLTAGLGTAGLGALGGMATGTNPLLMALLMGGLGVGGTYGYKNGWFGDNQNEGINSWLQPILGNMNAPQAPVTQPAPAANTPPVNNFNAAPTSAPQSGVGTTPYGAVSPSSGVSTTPYGKVSPSSGAGTPTIQNKPVVPQATNVLPKK